MVIVIGDPRVLINGSLYSKPPVINGRKISSWATWGYFTLLIGAIPHTGDWAHLGPESETELPGLGDRTPKVKECYWEIRSGVRCQTKNKPVSSAVSLSVCAFFVLYIAKQAAQVCTLTERKDVGKDTM